MIAINLGDHDEHEIVELVNECGATQLERAEGTWQDERWMALRSARVS